MSEYRAVLFDFFGTLTRAVVRGPWHAAIARRLGCPPDRFTQALDDSFSLRATGVFGGPQATMRWVCRRAGVQPSSAQLRAAVQARLAAVWADTRLRPDAVAVLSAVRAGGMRTALISDCGYELPEFLPSLPVSGLLDTCVYSVDVGTCKPDPAMYLTACHRLGVTPGQCLYVGDGGGRELTGALRLGMTAVRLAAEDLPRHLVFSPDQEFTGPAVSSLYELLELLPAGPAGAARGGVPGCGGRPRPTGWRAPAPVPAPAA